MRVLLYQLNNSDFTFVYQNPKVMNALKGIVEGVCPVCGTGKIFNHSPFLSLKPPAMNTSCSHCGHMFEKEAGFFWGAMFVSYAFTVVEIIATILVSRLFLSGELDTRVVWPVVAVIILLSTFNYKLSRIVWIYFFAPKKSRRSSV